MPDNERERLASLRALSILDTPPEESYDRITRLASEIVATPVALVSLVDEHRQWFKSRHNFDATETGRDVAFCAHAILTPDVFVVADAERHELFRTNPLVTGGPQIRFYAGAPLKFNDDQHLGTLCVIDYRPRDISPEQTRALEDLAATVTTELRLRSLASELRRSNEALEQSNRDLEVFSHAVGHDLSAPLRFIQFLAQEALDDHGASLPEEVREQVSRIYDVATRGGTMVQGLAHLSQLGSSDGVVRQSVEIPWLVEDVIEELEAQDSAQGMEVDVVLEVQRVEANAEHLRRVLANLVQNAVKYGGRPLRLRVRTSANDNDTALFRVEDNGPGIRERDRERAVLPFARLQRDQPGSGLGLALVKRLVELNDGRLWIEDSELGGAAVCFKLPTAG